MTALWLTLVLVAGPNSDLKVKGFTHDGRLFVFTGVVNDGMEVSDEQTAVIDLLTGQTQVLAGGAARVFLKAHPIDPAIASRVSPDGKATADVVIDTSGGDGTWKGGSWSPSSASGWQLSVTRDGKTTRAASASLPDSVAVWWSPDGKHTVWMTSVRSRGMRDPGSTELLIGTDGRPSVAVVTEKARTKDAVKLAETLSLAGFAVLQTGASKQPRTASVVFAAPGFEADARALAAAIPGGATVEKLTWKASTDLVVSAAPDALK